jgi:hypothetical protein
MAGVFRSPFLQEARAFSLFAISVFFLEMLSPFSYAAVTSAGPEAPSSSFYSRYYANYGTPPANKAKTVSFAATPTPTPTPAPLGACTVSKMTPSQVQAFWEATYNFQADEINALQKQQLLKNDASAFTGQTKNGQVVVNVFADEDDENKRVMVKDAAGPLGMSAEELADLFAVDPQNGSISMRMYQAAMDREPSLLEKFPIFKDLAKSVMPTPEPPAYQNMKIKLPNGKTFPLKELLSYSDLNTGGDSCMLDNSLIRGRVSYMGQLDRDLFVGFDRSSTTLKSNQHLTSANTFAAMTLNDGGSVIVPLRLERYMGAVKGIMLFDTIANMIEVGYMFNEKTSAADAIEDKGHLKEEVIERSQVRDPYSRNALLSASEGNPVTSGIIADLTSPKPVDWNSMLGKFNNLDAQIRQDAADLAAYNAQLAGLPIGTDFLTRQAYIQKIGEFNKRLDIASAQRQTIADIINKNNPGHVGVLTPRVAFNPPVAPLAPPAGIAGTAGDFRKDILYYEDQIGANFGLTGDHMRDINMQREINELELEKKEKYDKELPSRSKKIGRVMDYLEGKLVVNFYMGMLWLGTGRFVPSLANGLVLSSNGKRASENYLKVYINNYGVLSTFRKASKWALSGFALELVSSWLKSGIPKEVYGVGPMFFINIPDASHAADSSSSTTSVSYTGMGWNVATSWGGKSDSTLFEDVSDNGKYARMPLFINNMTVGAALNKRDLGANYYEALMVLAPILSWKVVAKSVDRAFVPISRLIITDLYVQYFIDPLSYDDQESCRDDVVRNKVYWYASLTAAGHLTNFINMAIPFNGMKTFKIISIFGDTTTKLGKFAKAVQTITTTIDPIEHAKMSIVEDGFAYVSTCKDTSYTVVGYQPLDKKPANGIAQLASKLKPLSASNVLGNLSFGSALAGVGSSLETDAMTEIVNLRATMEEQQGMVRPSKLYYLHLDGANEISWGIYSALEKGGCFRKCFDSADSAICLTQNGTIKYDKKTGKETKLTGADNSLLYWLDQPTGRVMVPDTLISAPLTCGSGSTILQADYKAHLKAVLGCATTECIVTQLVSLSRKPVSGGDLTTVLGEVTAIKTSQGQALFSPGKPVRFVFTTGSEKYTKTISPLGPGFFEIDGVPRNENDTGIPEEDLQKGTFTETRSRVGTEIQSPSPETLEAVDKKQITERDAYDSARVNIKGDGSVTVSGYIDGVNFDEKDVGTLEAVTMENGRMEYDPAQNRLVVALQTLGEAKFANSIDEIVATAEENVDEDGNPLGQAIGLGVTAKPGMEDAAKDLSDALKQVQGDGGFQMFETANKTYFFTKNEVGEDILRVCDRITGTCTDYKITGKVTSDGKTVTVPTDKGDFRFQFYPNPTTGFPTIDVSGPDGYRDIATLLAARGQNGIFVFDPTTGLAKILNGQDLMLNDAFRKGLTFLGSSDGTKGIAGPDYLGYPYGYGEGAAGGYNPLALPSVPNDDFPAAALMLSGLLAAVLLVRCAPSGKKKETRR